MTAYRELRSADLRKINGLTRRMARCENLAELERTFVRGAVKCVPIDYLAWNLFNRDRTKVIYVGSTDQLKRRAVELLDEVNGYLLDWHPILSTVGWQGIDKRLATMSDFQSIGQFRRTPLYSYAYRHLDADYQAAESIGCYGNINLTMSYNRRLCDFTRRERAMLRLINRRLDAVAREIHRRQILRRNLERFTALVGVGKIPTDDLTAAEIHGMASIVRGDSAAPDTRTRLQEKLGLESAKQVASLVVDSIRSGAGRVAAGGPCGNGSRKQSDGHKAVK